MEARHRNATRNKNNSAEPWRDWSILCALEPHFVGTTTSHERCTIVTQVVTAAPNANAGPFFIGHFLGPISSRQYSRPVAQHNQTPRILFNGALIERPRD
jgi:hypothetical protein